MLEIIQRGGAAAAELDLVAMRAAVKVAGKRDGRECVRGYKIRDFNLKSTWRSTRNFFQRFGLCPIAEVVDAEVADAQLLLRIVDSKEDGSRKNDARHFSRAQKA